MELEEKYNNLIRTRVMQVLQPLYGEDNVRVSVNTVVDLDRSYTDSTDYSLEPWAQGKDDGIIGTQIWDDSIVRDNGDTAGGVAGTQSNADLNTYVENQVQPDGTESTISASGETDRLVDTTKQQVEHVAGYISDVMVSVTINQDAAGSVSQDDLYNHVGRAAGISTADQQSKISILVSPFYEEPNSVLPAAGISPWILYAALGGVGVFLVLVLAITLLARAGRKNGTHSRSPRAWLQRLRPLPSRLTLWRCRRSGAWSCARISESLPKKIRRLRADGAQLAAGG